MTARRIAAALLAMGLATLVSGCVQQTEQFNWGGYEHKLYNSYRDSDKQQDLVSELETIALTYGEPDMAALAPLLPNLSSSDPKTRRLAEKQAAALSRQLDHINGRVAPGLLAELGYLYLEAGKADLAVVYFEREKRRWPESTYFMNVMIKLAKAGTHKASPQQGDGHAEGGK